MPAQPKLTLVGRQHRVYAFLSVAGFVGAAVLTVVPVSTTNRGREISCGSLLSPLNQENVSEAISCDLALNPRRFLTLVAFGLAIVLLTMLLASMLGPPVGRRGAPIRGRHVEIRMPRPKDASQVEATIDEAVVAEMGWTDTETKSWPIAIRSGSILGALVVVDDMTRSIGGVVSVAVDTTMADSVSLGFWAGPEHRGRGVMSDAVAAVVDDLIEKGTSVRAETAVSNHAAQRVIERAGLVLIGRRTVRLPNGSFVDGLIFARHADGVQPPAFDSNAAGPAGNGVWGPPAV